MNLADRPLVRRPALWLAAALLLYGALFSDNDGGLTTSGFWLLAALPLLPLALARGKRGLLLSAGCGAFMALTLWGLKSSQPYVALLLSGGAALMALTLYWRSRGELDWQRAGLLLAMASMLLRLAYVGYTSCIVRQHDVWRVNTGKGHIGYIQYILENGFSLPALVMDPRTHAQFSHPPLHHWLAAVWVQLHLWAGDSLNNSLESIQALTLFYSGLINIISWRLMRALGLTKGRLLMAFALVCFSPALVFLSGSINNDCLVTLLSLAALLGAVRWYQRPSCRAALLTGLGVALALLAKTSGLLAAAGAGVIFLGGLARRRVSPGRFWGQAALCAGVVILLGFPYGLWNYLRYGMSPSYVLYLGEDSHQYIGAYPLLERLFSLDWARVQHLYISLDGPLQDYNIPLAVLKGGVFEEYTLAEAFTALWWVNALLLAVYLAVAAAAGLGVMRRTGAQLWKARRDPLWLGLLAYLAVLAVSFIMFCMAYPHVCSMSIRYLNAALPIGAACYAAYGRRFRLRAGLCIAFCTLSCAQFFLMAVGG